MFAILLQFYIAVISTHAFILAISHFIMCVNSDWNSKYQNCLVTVYIAVFNFENNLFKNYTG